MPTLDPSYWWLIVGAVCLAVEAFGIPGIGFVFAGLAAIITGLLTQYAVLEADNLLAQLASFATLTAVFAALLWKKLKNWRTSPSEAGDYSNIVGDMAIVGRGGLHVGKSGQVTWSGTMMTAVIDEQSEQESFEEGDTVRITSVKGSRLIVREIT